MNDYKNKGGKILACILFVIANILGIIIVYQNSVIKDLENKLDEATERLIKLDPVSKKRMNEFLKEFKEDKTP